MGVLTKLGEAVHAGWTFMQGMKVTFKEMVFEEPVTVCYPEVKPEIPPWFRGIPVLKTDLRTGAHKCTSCEMCADACPVDVIVIEYHQDPKTKKKILDRYAIDMSRCMLCNLCVEACPFECLVMAMDYELAVPSDPENLVFEKEDLLRLGLKYSRAEAKGARPDNTRWIFHPLTDGSEADMPAGIRLGQYGPYNPPPEREEPEAEAAPAAANAKGEGADS